MKGDRDALKANVKTVALNPHIGGGAWGITFGGPEVSTKHGVRERFICDRKGRSGNKACGCLWDIFYEESTDGWVLQRYPHLQNHVKQEQVKDESGQVISVSLVVAHMLTQPDSIAELRTTASGRQIPPELRDTGFLLSKICTPAQTHHGLQYEVSPVCHLMRTLTLTLTMTQTPTSTQPQAAPTPTLTLTIGS